MFRQRRGTICMILVHGRPPCSFFSARLYGIKSPGPYIGTNDLSSVRLCLTFRPIRQHTWDHVLQLSYSMQSVTLAQLKSEASKHCPKSLGVKDLTGRQAAKRCKRGRSLPNKRSGPWNGHVTHQLVRRWLT